MEYTLEKLEVYQLAESFSDAIWKLVGSWTNFQRDTIGKQIVRSADSISANIAEGYGRYYYKESKQFFFYSRGSLQETKSWLSKCKRRNILETIKADELITDAEKILAKLNGYIKFVAKSPKHNKSKDGHEN
ncbi:MAG: four helix bundle protein [Chitinophagaceae bacterium]|nr:four helix bundle protein [Chitinophagaceae bacterium]